MARLTDIARLPAAEDVRLSQEASIARGAVLLASNGRSRLVVSRGDTALAELCLPSQLPPGTDNLCFEHIAGGVTSRPVDGQAHPATAVSFVSVQPAASPERNVLTACVAVGSTLHVVQLAEHPAHGSGPHALGTLSAPEPMRWLGASWHPHRSGLLAAVCQAEVRVTLCGVAGCLSRSGAGAGSGTHSAAAENDPARIPSQPPLSSSLLELCSLPPPQQQQQRQLGQLKDPGPRGSTASAAAADAATSAAPPLPCRSTQCHVAWVGEPGPGTGAEAMGHRAEGDVGPSGMVTLVVAWGPELELVSWRAAELAAAAAVANGAGTTADTGCPLVPASRRTLLLGVPGPLSAMVTGPYGSVVATAAAGLTLAAPSPAAAMQQSSVDGEASQDGTCVPAGQQHQQQAAADPEVVDLRGRMASDGELGPRGGLGTDRPGPSLAALLNISGGAALDDGLLGGGGGRKVVPAGFLLPPEAAATRAPPASSAAAEAAAPATLCVVWPGGLASTAPAAAVATPTAVTSRGGGAGGGGGGFRSVAPLPLPRPDLLSCCGSLVLAASSVGPPLVVAYRLTPGAGQRHGSAGGLTRLALLAPELPGLADPTRGRLRGLAAVLPPAAAGASAGAGGGGGGAVLVTVVGEVDAAAAGGGIVGFGRQPGRPAGVRMAPLLACRHLLPPALAEAEAEGAGTEPCAAAAAVGVPAPPGTAVASAATTAAAPAAAGVPTAAVPAAAPGADAVAAAVVGQLSELLAGLRAHVDGRLDALAGCLQAHAARLDRIEASLATQQGAQQAQAVHAQAESTP